LGNLLRAVKERRIDSSTVFGSDEIGRLAAEFHALYSDLAVSEEALRAANDELEERVRERTSKLTEATRRLSDEVGERERAQEGLRASLGEKELLLKEIHHRVKNNLQVIVSLLRLQSSAFDDERARRVFRECQNRIQAMSLVHERLYQSNDFARVSLDHYIRQLVRGIVSSYGPTAERVAVRSEVEGVTLPIDTAIPCGFIINELVTNSIVHAFPGERGGSVLVALREVAPDTFELVVSDDGAGMPPDLRMDQLGTLGLYLVQTIARDQLRGSVDIVSPGRQGGTDVVVRFSRVHYAERF
jgi:two-component sensor histidine kinase